MNGNGQWADVYNSSAVDVSLSERDHGAVQEIEFPPELARRFEALARQRGMTPSALLAEAVERKLAAIERGESARADDHADDSVSSNREMPGNRFGANRR